MEVCRRVRRRRQERVLWDRGGWGEAVLGVAGRQGAGAVKALDTAIHHIPTPDAKNSLWLLAFSWFSAASRDGAELSKPIGAGAVLPGKFNINQIVIPI